MATELIVPPFGRPPGGIVLICRRQSGPKEDAGVDPALVLGLLERTQAHIILHGARSVNTAELTQRPCAAGDRSRLWMAGDVPLQPLLGIADILICDSMATLIEGCEMGLKPVQIGGVIDGSTKISHIFTTADELVTRVAAGTMPAGRLTLTEYAAFEKFLLTVAGDRAFDRAKAPSWFQRQAAAMANPVAAWRLFRHT